ncbi:hypothetical protein EHI8A_223140 [Entamoeba histolytica HM-1:IMSS-B]|uniref:Uncharacterized protein n=1 Tax=Entamoeba histolytica HM-1:IMSS-B TaxID=885319 RepID=M3TN73_ENTH1|nr:hypothetical protein EHI8A_223140 [Entamoeba histolytica HM-1:IMSS-B]
MTERPAPRDERLFVHDARVIAGVLHEDVDQQRAGDAAGHVPVVAALHADALEPQGQVFGGAAEDGDGQGIGQADAQGADLGGEQLGLHHGVDRGVEADDHQRHHDQAEGAPPGGDAAQGGEDRVGEQRAEHAEGDQYRAPADAVGQGADHGLQQHEQEQRRRRDGGGVGLAHAHRIDQVLLHVGGVGVEGQGAAHGQADHGEEFLGMAHQGAHQGFLGFFGLLEGAGLFHAAAQVERGHGAGGADQEGDAPAPAFQLFDGQGLLQRDQRGQR